MAQTVWVVVYHEQASDQPGQWLPITVGDDGGVTVDMTLLVGEMLDGD